MFIRTAIAVLVAAAVIQTGAAFAQTAPQPAPPPAAAQRHHHSSLFKGLNLTSGQKARIKAIHQKYRAQNQGVADRSQRRASMHAQRQEIMAVLNPDQRAKFQQRLQTLRERHRQDQQVPSAPSPQSR